MRSSRRLALIMAALAIAACDDPPTSPLVGTQPVEAVQAAPTQVIDLGTLGGSYSQAFDINDNNVVVGVSETPNSYIHAFRWTKSSGMKNLGSLGGAESMSMATGINEHGFITGLSNDANGKAHLVVWTPQGQLRDLGAFPAFEGLLDAANVVGITDRNEIAGNYYETELFGWGLNIPFHWTQQTGIVDYPWGVPSDPESDVERYLGAINDRGDVVGERSGQLYFSERGVGFRILTSPWSWTRPRGISDYGVIIGSAMTSAPFSDWFPFRWTRTAGFQALGDLGGGEGHAYDVNDRGEIVGSTTLASGEFRAFFWSEGRGMVDLGPGSAAAINEKSVIVGSQHPRAKMWIGTGGVTTTEVALWRDGSPD